MRIMTKVTIRFILFFIFILPLTANNSWVERASMSNNLRWSGSFIIGDSVFVGCGFDGSNYKNNYYKYVVPENKWYSVKPLPGRGRTMGTAFALNGFGYAGIGWTGNAPTTNLIDFYKYDPNKGSWTKLNDYPGYATHDMQSFVINGKAYVCGGFNIATASNELWQYIPENDKWIRKANMLNGIARGTAFSIGKYGYVLTGVDPNSNRNSNLYRYDSENDKWEDLGTRNLTQSLFCFAFSLNGKGYIGGGWVDDSNKFWEFDPETNKFRRLRNVPTPVHGCATFTYNGRAFVYDDYFASAHYSNLFEYIPADQYINTDSLNYYSFCEDSGNIKVYFSSEGKFNQDNEFQVEMSLNLNKYDSTKIVAIGKNSPLVFPIPKNYDNSSWYAFRVNSTSPKVFGNYYINYANLQHYPPAPVLTIKHDTLFSTSYAYNYWYKDGLPYDTTTTRFLKVKEPGIYKVYNSYGCASPFSNEIVYQPDEVYEEKPDEIVNIKENIIYVNDKLIKDISIYDVTGRLIQKLDAKESQNIELNYLNKGIYLIICRKTNNTLILKKLFINN